MNIEKSKVANELGVRRWLSGRMSGIQSDGTGYFKSRPKANNDCCSDRWYSTAVADLLCFPKTRKQYLDMTQAWRPLDIHPDWRTWGGATTQTKGSK